MDITSYLLGKNSSGGGGGGGLDWTAVGYSNTPQAIIEAYNVAVNIKNNWTSTSRPTDFKDTIIICPYVDTSSLTSWGYFASECKKLLQIPLLDSSNVTNMNSAFSNSTALMSVPLFNTSKVTNFGSMFSGCTSLTTIPIFDTSSGTAFGSMFDTCYKLSNESLDNILQMCINATSYTGAKTLRSLGFRSNVHSSAKIQALPHYQAFLDAGWTIGY